MSGIFPLLLLTGRPASGKSEILDYLGRTPAAERRRRFHIGELAVLDDFPLLWAWFEEDRLLTEMGRERLHSTPDGYFLAPHLWDLLVRRLCLEYDKLLRAERRLHERTTVLLEFSRGSEHGGYARALAHLSDAVLRGLAVVYVRVSFEESLRKNRRRFNPERAHSILEHGLPDEKLERLYREDDWERLAAADPGFLEVGGRRLPYAVFENEDDVTTAPRETPEAPPPLRRQEPLGERLEQVLGRLWELAGGGRPPAA